MHVVLWVLRCMMLLELLNDGLELVVPLDTTKNYIKLGEMPRQTSAEDVVMAQPEPVCPLANRDHSHGATDTGKRKGKTTSRDGDRSKVEGAIDPGSTVYSTAERKSSLDLNDGREAFGWVRSVHNRDPEGLYLKVSQLGGNQYKTN
ncbi:hypothetical protein ARMSODRAFT_973370 [Armillaria solidipes]|uniref:Hypervirulence associated protein TUDOR domain-containing protein n=1 Tax=Armillaria solidipes TaxID=1076256 RepID=A0A2H3BLR1_9AGAR|nr:hypothetical protein ARMSODRAFT_973370 [Armillaria solidipes]